ncbi:MAG: hypothetical protein ACYDD2_13075 [Candidatus Acidiferrales bacterium]
MRALRHLKKAVLQSLADGRPRGSHAVCEVTGYLHPRSMISYLRRLQRQGLLRASLAGRITVFRISPKGAARLHWFLANPRYDFLRRFRARK